MDIIRQYNKLEKLVQGKASYSFTMPKTGKFNIKATGKCDPSASKSVAVQAIIPTLQLSEQDIHDIIKVVSTEVELLIKNENERKRQAQGVIDTILNRIFLEPHHNVRSILNQPGQFSQISGNPKSYGSVEKMPDSDIKSWTAKYTEEYLKERTKNSNSSVGGNYNYLNPHANISQKIMKQWGNDVVAQAKISGLIFGEGNYKHYHGTAKGHKKAPDFVISLPKNYKSKWSK